MDKEIIKIENLIHDDTNENKQKPKFNFVKLFSGKNLKIIVLIIICIIGIVLFLKMTSTKTTNINSTTKTSSSYKTTLEYSEILENKLENVLSQIKGAGNVKVMITLEGSPELVYAMDSNEKVSNSQNGSTTTSATSPILIENKGASSPLILTEKLPKVKGVIVVSTGASDIGIKLDILNSVSTLLDISTDKINVLKGI